MTTVYVLASSASLRRGLRSLLEGLAGFSVAGSGPLDPHWTDPASGPLDPSWSDAASGLLEPPWIEADILLVEPADGAPLPGLFRPDGTPPPAASRLHRPSAPGASRLDGPSLVLLTDHPENGWTDGWGGAVRAILPRSATDEQIAAALQAVAAGLAVVHPGLLPLDERTAPALGEEALTARELEVLRLLAEGHSNRAIGGRLGISEHTIKFHVSGILGKLQAGSRTEAVTEGIRRGLIML